jgi:hypothetical protein
VRISADHVASRSFASIKKRHKNAANCRIFDQSDVFPAETRPAKNAPSFSHLQSKWHFLPGKPALISLLWNKCTLCAFDFAG